MKKNTCKHTYCNPLPIPNIPRGKDEWYTNLCSITQNKISQLLKASNYLITYLNNKCQEMLEED